MPAALVIKNDGIGDLVITREVINALSDHFSGGLDLVCCDLVEALVQRDINVRKTFLVSRDPHFRLPPFSKRAPNRIVRDTAKATWCRATASDRAVVSALRERHYDLAIVLRRFIRQSTFLFMAPVRAARKVVCWQYPTNLSESWARRLSSGWEEVTAGHDILFEGDYYRAVLEQVLGPTRRVAAPSPKSRAAAVPDPRRVAMVLGNVRKGVSVRFWSAYMSRLCAIGYSVTVFGGADTRDAYGDHLEAQGIPCRAGGISLTEAEDEIVHGFGVAMGNDTGLMHQVCGRVPKTVVVCAGETPFRFFPHPGEEGQFIVHKSLPCVDCGYCTEWRRSCVEFPHEPLSELLCDILGGRVGPGVFSVGESRAYRIAHRWVDGLSNRLSS